MSHAIANTTEQFSAVSAREASLALGVSERTVRRAIARGELAAIKHGRAFRITPEALMLYSTRRRAPAATGRFCEPAASSLLTVLPRQAARLDTLPAPLTRFIGREREVAAVADLLRPDDVRLVTLTGPGGVGKTRLALRVAEDVAADFSDGLVFVPLVAIGRAGLVLTTIARALDVRESPDRPLKDGLVAALRDRRLLLVLDNFEHLLEAAIDLGDLLTSCSRLTMLVTSREPLRLSGERRFPTAPLALPTAGDVLAPDQLSTYEAIALFVERARQVRPDFTLDAENAAAVLEMCRRLDGLPLAIELAAAWLRVVSPAVLLTRLERRLPLLTGGAPDQPARLRTMRDAIAWSHDLLSDEERRLIRRLAVFVGGFTLDAAEDVGGRGGRPHAASGGTGAREGLRSSSPSSSPLSEASPPSVLDLLAALIDKSLLQIEQAAGHETRFLMLETVREFAVERLEASGEEAATREAHAAHYLALAEAAATDARRASDRGWMRRLAAERPNLRAALDWLEQTGRTGAALQMSGALWHYWYRLGDLAEGRSRLERALAAAPPDGDPVLRARALRGAGVLAWQSAEYDQSRERLEAALVAYRALGDQTGIAWVLNSLGCLFATVSAAEQAEAYMTEALAIFHELDDAVGIANLTCNLGELAEVEGHHDVAITRLEAGLAMWRTLGDRVGAVRAMVFLGQALLAENEAARAEAVLMDALAAIRDIDYKQILPAALRAIAQLAARRGDHAAAARWYGAAAGVMDVLGMTLPAARRAGHERAVAGVRERLGEAGFAAIWAAGRGLSAARAIAELLADDATITGDISAQSDGGLSPREREVLRLLAAGGSDKQIADALFITRRTASKHVSAILAKLEVDSRTAAVATAIRLGLA
jgi:non-specific serine/threonine protein kinase